MKTPMNINGVSTCKEHGSEHYEHFISRRHGHRHQFVQYDYRTLDGELFTCVRDTLDACRLACAEWLSLRSNS